MATTTPWDIYAEQLSPVGYGYPLWIPEPDHNGREVLVGDVGWLHEGQFRPLFNARNASDRQPPGSDPESTVPPGFTPLHIANNHINKVDNFVQNFVASRSVRVTDANASVDVTVSASV